MYISILTYCILGICCVSEYQSNNYYVLYYLKKKTHDVMENQIKVVEDHKFYQF